MSETPKMINPPESWHPRPPASEAVLDQLIVNCPMLLPAAYLNLLRVSNGGGAELSVLPWSVDFWAAGDLLRLNQKYGIDKDAPNFLAFGSNLGEEVLAFDKREGTCSGVYMLPWHDPKEAFARKVASSLEKLVAAFTDGD